MRAVQPRASHRTRISLILTVLAALALVLFWARSSAATPDPLRSTAGHFAIDLVAVQTPARVLVVPPFVVDGEPATDLGRYLAIELSRTLDWRGQFDRVYGPEVTADFAPDGFLIGRADRSGCSVFVSLLLSDSVDPAAPIGPVRELEVDEIPRWLRPTHWAGLPDCAPKAKVDWADVTFGPFVGIGATGVAALQGAVLDSAPGGTPADREDVLMDHFQGTAPPLSAVAPTNPLYRVDLGWDVTVGPLKTSALITIAAGSGDRVRIELPGTDGAWDARLERTTTLMGEVGPAFSIPSLERRFRPWITGRLGLVNHSMEGRVDPKQAPLVSGSPYMGTLATCKTDICTWSWSSTAPVFGAGFGFDLRTPTRSALDSGLILRPYGYVHVGPSTAEVGMGISVGLTGLPFLHLTSWR